MIVLGSGASGRVLDHESGALLNGINALIKEVSLRLLASYIMWEYNEKFASQNQAFTQSCVCVCVCVCARVHTCPHMRSVTQSSPTLCYSRDCSQSHQSMEFSRQEYWSRLIFPTPGDLPKPGIKLTSLAPPALEEDSLLLCPLEAVPQPYHYPKFRLPTSRTTRKKLILSVSQLIHGILLEQPLADWDTSLELATSVLLSLWHQLPFVRTWELCVPSRYYFFFHPLL